jgi:hypothetical protein
MTQADSTVLPAHAATTAKRPLLLWLSSGYWLFSGLAGIVPVLMVIPTLHSASTFVLLFVAVAALSHLLSLAGAVQLFRRRQSAVPLLAIVFALYVGTLLFSSASPASWGVFTIFLVAVSASTIGYAMFLKRKGVLT